MAAGQRIDSDDGGGGGYGPTGPLVRSDVVIYLFIYTKKAASSAHFKIFLFTSMEVG